MFFHCPHGICVENISEWKSFCVFLETRQQRRQRLSGGTNARTSEINFAIRTKTAV